MTAPDIEFFNRKQVRHNRNRYAANIDQYDFLFSWTLKNLIERLDIVKRKFPVALQIGARTPCSLSNDLKKKAGIESLFFMDLGEQLLNKQSSACLVGDEEALPFKENSLDLIISPLALHAVNDVPGALIQMRRALKPDGLFIAAMPGGETLKELRESLMHAEIAIRKGTSPRIAPFADKQQMGALMQRAGFALPVVDSEKITVTYDNALNLMKDLRHMGESNTIKNKSPLPLTRAITDYTTRFYQKNFADSQNPERITATFEIIFMIGWTPHASQQQPLKPGSAEIRLADALNTDEEAL